MRTVCCTVFTVLLLEKFYSFHRYFLFSEEYSHHVANFRERTR